MSLRHWSDQADLELGEHAGLSVRESNALRERQLAANNTARKTGLRRTGRRLAGKGEGG